LLEITQKNKQKVRQSLANIASFAVSMETQQIYATNTVRFTYPGKKNKTFPLNQNLTRANYGIYVETFVICNQQYVGL